jgi:sigma-B regulation protein RsbU (phosphoserine phosphatase)
MQRHHEFIMSSETVVTATDPALQLPIFIGLDTATATSVLQHLHRDQVSAGQVIIEQGSSGDDLYVVERGQVKVTRLLENGIEEFIAILEAGEIFGEMALLEQQPRSARIVAHSDATLLSISRQTFNELVTESPAVAIHLLRRVSARLRQRNDQQEALLTEKCRLVNELAAKNAELERTLLQLQKAMETVAEHERVIYDLEIARQIQFQMLPATFPCVPGLELFASTVPSQWVGGDFFDVLYNGQNRICLLLGDVSGKGIAAAMQMARLMGDFRAAVCQREDPLSVVHALNESVCARNLNWASFVTLQYVVIDTARQSMEFICAGHPPLIMCRANGQLEWLGHAANLPLGIDVTHTYQIEVDTILPGDRLLLYSDGAYEAKNAANQMFGLSQLATAFARSPNAPKVAIEALRHALTDFSGLETLTDDTTFLCVYAPFSTPPGRATDSGG